MLSERLLGCLACSMLACSASRPPPTTSFPKPAPPTVTANTPLVGYVVLDPTAVLYTEPVETAERGRPLVEDKDAVEARSEDSGFSLFRFVEEADGFAQIESIPTALTPKTYTCTASMESLRPFRLTLYAKPAALADVTTRRVRVEYTDGSAATLVPGVVLHPQDAISRRVIVDAIEFSIAVPVDAIGHRFVPGTPFKTGTSAPYYLDGGFTFAGKTWGDDALADSRSVYEKRKSGTAVVATMRSPCVQYEAVVQESQLDESAMGIGGLGLSGFGGGPRDFLKKGASIFWRNGKPAGTAAERWELPWSTVGSGGKRRCFNHLLSSSGDTKEEIVHGIQSYLQLCVNEKDVERGY